MEDALLKANQLLNAVQGIYSEDKAEWKELKAWVDLFKASDLELIYNIKMSLRYATVLFEDYQSKAIESGRRQIINTLLKITYLIQDYYKKFAQKASKII